MKSQRITIVRCIPIKDCIDPNSVTVNSFDADFSEYIEQGYTHSMTTTSAITNDGLPYLIISSQLVLER